MADRQHFLAGLGAALLNLSDGTRANRAENQAKLRDKQRQDMELARMALSREQFALDQKGFEAGQQRDARVFAKDVLEDPTAVLDDAAAQRVDDAGYGFRLAPKQEGTLSSKPFVMDTINATPDVSMLRPEAYATGAEATPVSEGFNPGVMQTQSPGIGPGRQVIPTSDQAFQLEQQGKARNLEETRRRAQAAVSQQGFYKMPELNRAVVWQQAGFDGNPPQSLEDWKQREQFQADLQRNNMLAVEGVRHAGDMQEIGQRVATATTTKPATNLSATERNALGDAALSVSQLTQLRQLRTAHGAGITGQVTGRLNSVGAKMPENMRGIVGGVAPGFVEFQAKSAGLRNRMIRAITGAAVGVQEEQRIMGEIPTENDEPDVWEAKAAATEKNLRELAARIQAGGQMPMPGESEGASVVPAPGSGQPRIVGRRPAGGGQ